jgi:sterol desaturase/sphingolipid hydroxylase (fatty acid hydroxylase superfamily)
MSWLILGPLLAFLVLFLGETFLPSTTAKFSYHRSDWLLNLTGFFMQGLIVPWCSYLLATELFPLLWPSGKGILALNWWSAFLLNFIVVDFIYYWQHFLFHHNPWLWQWHRCHHASPRVDIWATARNSIFINFFFVYMLLNPLLGYLCQSPAGFFAGVTLTACLDLLRHCRIDMTKIPLLRRLTPWLGLIFVIPSQHHRHHAALATPANFGANLIIWDKLFHTFCQKSPAPVYRDPMAAEPLQQLLYPFRD